MWKTTNALGKECIWYSQEEVQEKFSKIKNLCNGINFQTNEGKQLKNLLLKIINEVEDE